MSSKTLIAATLVAVLFGCGTGKRPFAIVQVCLRTDQDRLQFTDELQQIARFERAQFVDNSEYTERELRGINDAHPAGIKLNHVINIGIDLGDGVGLTASNVGSPVNEVAVGFSEGSNRLKAHKFADAVIARFNRQWPIETVSDPEKSGALGMANCTSR